MTQKTITEYGVKLANGSYDFETAKGFGTLEPYEARISYQEQHNLRLEALGMEPQELTFVTRKKTTIYGDPVVIENPLELPEDPEA